MEFDKLPKEYQREVIAFFKRDKDDDGDKKKEEKLKKLSKEQLLVKKKELEEMIKLMEFEVDYLSKKKKFFDEVIDKKAKDDSGKESGSESD